MSHMPPPTAVVASVRRRLAAHLVDGVIVATAGYLVAALVGATLGPATELVVEDEATRVVVRVGRLTAQAMAVMLLSGAYFVVSWTRWTATLGQRLLGVRVLSVDTTQRLGVGLAVARWVALGGPLGMLAALTIDSAIVWSFVVFVALVLALVLLVSSARSSEGRGLHDRLAKTIVVRGAPDTEP